MSFSKIFGFFGQIDLKVKVGKISIVSVKIDQNKYYRKTQLSDFTLFKESETGDYGR